MEERTPGDEEKGPVRKRPRIDVDKDSSTDLEDNELRYSDQTGSIIQERNSPDPFPDLTKDQRVVLYTLLLCVDYRFDVVLDDDVTMGGIDVRRTLSELKEKGLVTRYSDSERFHISQNTKIMKSYGENCLLSDIDKDFYMQVASDYSLCMYTLEYLSEDTDIEQPVDTPITVMRLIVEGRIEALIDIGFDVGPFHWNFADKEFQTFIQEWCRMKNIDPIAWADGISFEEAVRFVSAYSILGRFEKGFTELVSDKKKWSILVFILMSENCSIRVNALWEEKHRQILGAFPSLRELNHDMRTTEAIDLIKDMVYNDKVLAMNGDGSNGTVGFVSDDVRHQVMGCFVLNCLKTDEDYKNYLNLSSVNSLLEYVRTWWHDPDYGERCMYIPERMNELLITQLGIDVIRHVMVEGREDRDCNFERFIGVREMVSERLNIPHSVFEERQDTKVRLCSFLKTAIQEQEVSNRWIYNSLIGSFMIGENSPISKVKVPREILDWDYAARSRYAECARKGTQTIHRARAMIVGCAGAGKSTLLKRLQKRSLDELKQIQSTVGLEVHEDIFEITPESDCLKDLPVDTDKEGKQLLSVVDFGGQCAYYACHQVYLSRRAFYLLVIDMSKAFDEKVDPKLCEQAGTMFTDWSYGEYLLFWLKSVHTYCDNDAPVIIVGTHLDETKAQNSDTLYNNILDNLKFDKHLKSHLNRKRCFVLGFKSDGSSFHDTLSELEKCMVSIAKEDRWKESIPTDWALSEVVLGELRRRKVRIKSVKELSEKCFGENKEKYTQIRDILKFYHDIGVILHFDESSLAETVIIDIQWFVDSFKNIITDPNHIRDFVDNDRDWYSFYISGHILDRLLTDIWNSRHFEMDHWERNQNKANLLQYMQRLGLIAVGTYAHYIPCMNKRSFGMQEENFFHTIQSKTSVLVFRFQFLPYFFYFRLIVACLTKTNGEWIVLEDNGLCLYKNVACFVYKQHAIALAVNRCSIQLQVFQPSKDVIVKDVTLEIRDNIERLLNGLTSNFHKKVMYTVGYQCSKQEVFREHDDCFVEERDIHGKGKITCPKHGMINHHILSESTLLVYWKQDVLAEITDLDDLMDRDECTSLSEPELRKFNFKTFDELTKIGRDALQLYFDRIFPPMDLATVLTNNKQRLQQGHQRLDTDQCTLLFPGIKTIILFHLVLLRFHKGHIGLLLSVSISGVACSKKADKSIPSSTAFDVTVMYKLLRNYGPNLPPPTKGWGKKPDIGEKRPTDDVERIRFYRNEVEHKTRTTSVMEKDDFKLKWEDLSQAILRLSSGSLKKDIMALRQQR
ncbi:uncharacterized protein LOC125676189 isoform X3 [Ostrea edulis]|uniref:uncharacterized protein LOC125676189 isoform X3 n=1 Tax=Ostrea edulis TaxID=37623 RepID=UPI0024AEFA58|nr:uncharacterized protein LOC125676189 isoform X3 [Ostrea edulis]